MAYASEAFMEAYLNPPNQPGCGHTAHGADCLCDVDISVNDGLVWDNIPDEFLNVETHEQLVGAASMIWKNFDLPPQRPDAPMSCVFEDSSLVARMTELLRSGQTRSFIEAAVGKVTDEEWALMAAMFSPVGFRATYRLPEPRILELHDQGLHPAGIVRTINGEGSWPRPVHRHGVIKVIRRNGRVPHNGASSMFRAGGKPLPKVRLAELHDQGFVTSTALHKAIEAEGHVCSREAVHVWRKRYVERLKREAS